MRWFHDLKTATQLAVCLVVRAAGPGNKKPAKTAAALKVREIGGRVDKEFERY